MTAGLQTQASLSYARWLYNSVMKTKLLPWNFQRLGITSTVIDALWALRRGNTRDGLLLLGAAVISRRLPGIGVLASVGIRLYRRLRGTSGRQVR